MNSHAVFPGVSLKRTGLFSFLRWRRTVCTGAEPSIISKVRFYFSSAHYTKKQGNSTAFRIDTYLNGICLFCF